jgi:hypothetical protein
MRPNLNNKYSGGGYTGGYNSNNIGSKQIMSSNTNQKYNQNDLAVAKQSASHLLKGGQGQGIRSNNNMSSNIGSINQTSTNNYRKAFKPFESNTSDQQAQFTDTKPKINNIQMGQDIEENYVVEPKQNKMSSGLQVNNKLNFTQKYGTSGGNYGSGYNANQGQQKVGSYTASKMNNNTISKQGYNTGSTSTKTNYSTNGTSYGSKITSKIQKKEPYNINSSKSNYTQVDDNRQLKQNSNNNLPDETYNDDNDDGERIACQTCDRKFVPESYEKHAKVCKKVFASKRKAFDSKKHRIIDGEHAQILKRNELTDKKKGGGGAVVKKVNKAGKWKKQSEEFRAALRNANSGLPVPKQTNDDYTHCQYCGRNYNEQAYVKHLNWCKQKAMDNSKKPKMTTSMKPNLNMKFKK